MIGSLCIAPVAFAEGDKDPQTKIDEMQRQINSLTRSMKDKQQEKASLHQRIKRSNNRIKTLNRRINVLNKRLSSSRAELSELTRKERQLQKGLTTAQASLQEQLRTAHRMGDLPALKILLNQDDATKFSRVLMYYRYLSSAQHQQITRSQNELSALAAVKARRKLQQTELNATQKELNEKKRKLNTTSKENKRLLSQVKRSITGAGNRLKNLRKNQKDLQHLLTQLEETSVASNNGNNQPFAAMKNKLPFPVNGKVSRRFGTPLSGELKMRGLVINAKATSNIRAIYYGQVKFSDWMQGYGFLTIIDHGANYMSLYANSQRPLKEKGEWVAPGDIVATVGDSSGQHGTGLYFELLKNGQPKNPEQWIKSSVNWASLK